MQNNQAIFESLFNRNFAEGQHTGYLKEITNRHPYFSPAQFFLLQQVQNNPAAFEQQALKTNILFNNPLWLNFQLQQTNIQVETMPVIPAIIIAEPEPVAETIDEHSGNMDTPQPVIEPAEEDMDAPEPAKEPTAVMPETAVINAEPLAKTIEVLPVDAGTPTLDRYQPEKTTEAAGFTTAAEPGAVLETVDDLPDNTDVPDPAIHQAEKEIEPMHINLKMPEEKINLPEGMLFEPMHMVDYFASQGIKLSEDVQTGDKLGKQLKSFTEWLKTMKKVHVSDDAEKAVNTDSSIQVLAENSNTEAEVLTESMAEVFARQGKMGKASEVYQKLSLLNPAKSTYFAAKIENLKGL